MADSFATRLKNAWNAFNARDRTNEFEQTAQFHSAAYQQRPPNSRINSRFPRDKSIIASVCNRIAMDVASVDIRHIRVDENGQYESDIDSTINDVLNLEANIDQTGRAFIQDAVLSMFDEGVIALVPVDTNIRPQSPGAFEVLTMRTGKITQWYPTHVRVNLYNEQTGLREEVLLHKRQVAIIENPLYLVMNEPNSTLQRLIRKLHLLDVVDNQSGSGRLDMIIQLPYTIRTEARRKEAEERRKQIEDQLNQSKYGIAYADGTEKVIQLNRAVENNLMKQVEYLTSMLYSQLGMTPGVLDGTADEKEMLNYNNRSIEPILSAFVTELIRKFLTKTARAQRQTFAFFRDPFKLVPVEQIAEIADKFTRNEIMTSNEIRAVIGIKPSKDPKADELRNSNLSAPAEANTTVTEGDPNEEKTEV